MTDKQLLEDLEWAINIITRDMILRRLDAGDYARYQAVLQRVRPPPATAEIAIVLEWLRQYRYETGADSLVADRFDALAIFIERFDAKLTDEDRGLRPLRPLRR